MVAFATSSIPRLAILPASTFCLLCGRLVSPYPLLLYLLSSYQMSFLPSPIILILSSLPNKSFLYAPPRLSKASRTQISPQEYSDDLLPHCRHHPPIPWHKSTNFSCCTQVTSTQVWSSRLDACDGFLFQASLGRVHHSGSNFSSRSNIGRENTSMACNVGLERARHFIASMGLSGFHKKESKE